MPRLPELQLAIMQVLWRRGDATVTEVREDLHAERPLAYTTVATMLSKMERKGLVRHEREGRVFRFRPLVEQDNVSRSMVVDLAKRVFAGDVAEMVSHLMEECELGHDELARIKALIKERERELGRD